MGTDESRQRISRPFNAKAKNRRSRTGCNGHTNYMRRPWYENRSVRRSWRLFRHRQTIRQRTQHLDCGHPRCCSLL